MNNDLPKTILYYRGLAIALRLEAIASRCLFFVLFHLDRDSFSYRGLATCTQSALRPKLILGG